IGQAAAGRRQSHVVKLGSREVPLAAEVDSVAPLSLRVGFAGEEPETEVRSAWKPGEPVWTGSIGDHSFAVQVRRTAAADRLLRRGIDVPARVMSPRIAELDRFMPEKRVADTSRFLLCPMPGLVLSIAVSAGQEVKAGETLAVVEAMKMENVLRADRDVTIAEIAAKPGDSLAVDAVIMTFA
ncbi:MAG: acetyl/propionyl-CoA carboxylase subunit alpha, partial [Rhizobiales bacterium]|nr:acetyl/propionyl-CoA carboxylase subunit alpha [Hyphomicrobiales bacterium]